MTTTRGWYRGRHIRAVWHRVIDATDEGRMLFACGRWQIDDDPSAIGWLDGSTPTDGRFCPGCAPADPETPRG